MVATLVAQSPSESLAFLAESQRERIANLRRHIRECAPLEMARLDEILHCLRILADAAYPNFTQILYNSNVRDLGALLGRAGLPQPQQTAQEIGEIFRPYIPVAEKPTNATVFAA